VRHSTVAAPSRHSTVHGRLPPIEHKPKAPKPPRKPTLRASKSTAPKHHVAHVLAEGESTLLDVIDNLLSKGVVLNADVILALANVDLVYLRLSALLCAADRVLPALVDPRAR
jgi:hypothetical protein